MMHDALAAEVQRQCSLVLPTLKLAPGTFLVSPHLDLLNEEHIRELLFQQAENDMDIMASAAACGVFISEGVA